MESDQNGMWSKWNLTKTECAQNRMIGKKKQIICDKTAFKTICQQFMFSYHISNIYTKLRQF